MTVRPASGAPLRERVSVAEKVRVSSDATTGRSTSFVEALPTVCVTVPAEPVKRASPL